MNHNKEESVQYTMSQIKDAISELYTLAYKEGRTVDGQTILDMMTKEYQKGLDDAWKCASRIAVSTSKGGISVVEAYEIFGMHWDEVFSQYSASEAIAKIKEYEEKQKANKEIIQVGDEVVNKCGATAIVTRINDEKHVALMWDDGSCNNDTPRERIEKTGKHFDIQSILDQMNDEQ